MTFIVDGDCAIFQTTVTLANYFACDGKIEVQLVLGLEHCCLHTALTTTDVATFVCCKQRIIDLEIKVE
jgi:hypothetical protein